MMWAHFYEYIDLSTFRQLLKFISTANQLAKRSGHPLPKPTLDLVKHLRIHAGVSANWLELTQQLELLVQRLPNLRSFQNTSTGNVKQPGILWLISTIPTTSLRSIHLSVGPTDRDVFRIINMFPRLQSLTLVLFASNFRDISEWVFDHQHALRLPELQYFEWDGPLYYKPYFDKMLEFMALSQLGDECTVSLNLGPYSTESHHEHIFRLIGRNNVVQIHLQQANELLQKLFLMRSSGEIIRFQEIIIEPAFGLPCNRLLSTPIAAQSLVIRCHLEVEDDTHEVIQDLLDKVSSDSQWDKDTQDDLDGVVEIRRLQVRLDLSFHQHWSEADRMARLAAAINGRKAEKFLNKLQSEGKPVYLSYSIHAPGPCNDRWTSGVL
jgi:hypothetical protein